MFRLTTFLHLTEGAKLRENPENAGKTKNAGRVAPGIRGHETAKKIMIHPGDAPIKNQQAEYDQAVKKEFFMFQQPGYEQVGIEIIKGDEEDIIQYEKSEKIFFRKEAHIPGSGIKNEWQC